MSDVDNIGEVLAEYVRAGVVESQHMGHFLALNADGTVHTSKGNPDLLIFPRSSIKSIQTSAMVRHGLKLEPRLLALVSASHSGAQMHQDGALEILGGVGLDESHLQNMLDKPLGTKENRAWGDKPATRLAMNCSGKHAGMLATCVRNGWSIENYLDPSHPLQVACREELENLSGEKVTLTTADGCGAPLFLISVAGLARAMRAITISTDPVHQEVVNACRQFPEMVSGDDRTFTVLSKEVPGFFMKDGAEAVNIASLPDGRTFVFKIMDGSPRAIEIVTRAALRNFGVAINLNEPEVLGGGKPVGSIRASL